MILTFDPMTLTRNQFFSQVQQVCVQVLVQIHLALQELSSSQYLYGSHCVTSTFDPMTLKM